MSSPAAEPPDGVTPDIQSYASYQEIVRLAVPAMVLNAAGPATTTVQTVLLGRLREAPQQQVAAFAAVSSVASFVFFLLNFLVDGVSAKLGHAAGKQNWALVAKNARMAMLVTACAAALATAAFYAFRVPFEAAMHLGVPVRHYSEPFWRRRGVAVPLQLWNAGMSGLLQGHSRLALNAALAVGQACLELLLSVLILSGALPHVQPSVANLAFASIAAQACGTVCLTYAAVALPPRAAPQGYCLFTAPDGGERGAAQLAAHDAPPAAQRVSSPLAVGSATMQTEPLLLSSGTSASIASRSMHRDVHVASPASGSTQFGSVRGSGTGSEGTAFLSAQAPLASISTVASGALAPYSEIEETLASPSALQRALRREEGTRSGHLGVPDSVAAPLIDPMLDQQSQDADTEAPTFAHALAAFLGDGLNMVVRSTLLHTTFLVVTVVTARMGSSVLAAHQVVTQVWLLSSYIVDGFAAAGTVQGSRLVAMRSDPAALRALRALCRRLTLLGVATGCAFGALLFAFRRQVAELATRDAATRAQLRGTVWLLVCLAQPVNAGVFVFDGLLYAGQYFAFVRNQMISGIALVFAPALAIGLWTHSGLFGVWLAKALLNSWRLTLAVVLVGRRMVR